MKRLLKTIVPQGVVNTARNLRDAAGLSPLPVLPCRAKNLKPLSAINLPVIFSNETAANHWQDDHGAITGTFGNAHVLEGVNPGDRRALYYLVSTLKPQRVLEVGTHVGASTLYIARAMKSSGVHGKIVTIDITDVNNPRTGPWRRVGLSQAPKDYASQLDVHNLIEFRTGPALNYMNNTKDRFDFIFLDGDHSAQAVYQEVSAATAILNPGGLILLHDYYPEGRPLFPDGSLISGPYLALNRLMNENPGLRVMSLSPLPWTTKQGSHASSLALLISV